MNLIGLKKYRTRYLALVDDGQQYRYLCLSEKRMQTVVAYPKSEFNNHDHFLSIIRKFTQSSFYLPQPITIHTLSLAELDRVHAAIAQR